METIVANTTATLIAPEDNIKMNKYLVAGSTPLPALTKENDGNSTKSKPAYYENEPLLRENPNRFVLFPI